MRFAGEEEQVVPYLTQALENLLPVPCHLLDAGKDGLVESRLRQGGRVFAVSGPIFQTVDAAPHRLFTVFSGPDDPAVHRAAFPADQPLGEGVFAAIFPQGAFGFLLGRVLLAGPAGQLQLGVEEILPLNDGRMVVGDVVLGQLPVVLLLFLGEEVRCVGFLQQGVPHVFLIAEDVLDGAQRPLPVPLRGEDVPAFQGLFDLPQAAAQEEQAEDQPDLLRFLRHDLRLAVGAFPVAQHGLVGKRVLPLGKPFALAPFHIIAEGLALPLGKGAGPGKVDFAGGHGGVQPLLFEADGDAPLLEHPDVRDALQGVPGKSGQGFHQDQVHLAFLAQGDEGHEAGAVVIPDAADAVVAEDAGVLPFRVGADQVLVVGDLGLDAGFLCHLVRADPAVGRHPQAVVLRPGLQHGQRLDFPD